MDIALFGNTKNDFFFKNLSRAQVIEEISLNNPGRVAHGGSYWAAALDNSCQQNSVSLGCYVNVVDRQGLTLIVKP